MNSEQLKAHIAKLRTLAALCEKRASKYSKNRRFRGARNHWTGVHLGLTRAAEWLEQGAEEAKQTTAAAG